MAEYASNAKANAALTTGIIGTSLGALSSAGGVAGLLGFQPGGNKRPSDPEDRPVTWREMNLIRENFAKDVKIASLEGNQYADAKVEVVKDGLAKQAVHNAQSDGLIQMIGGQVAQLYTLTRLYVPNQNVAPGWGPAMVMPGMPPIPPVTPPTTSSGTTTTDTGTGN